MTITSMQTHLHYEQVESFVGSDSQGRFGVLAGHESLVTFLQPGLARFRDQDKTWRYIAQPGSSLLFTANHLQLSTTQFFISEDHDALERQLEQAWQKMARQSGSTKKSIAKMEHAFIRNLLDMDRDGETL